MKCSRHAYPGIVLSIIICLVLVSGCTFLMPPESNDTPPALITDVQTGSPAPSVSSPAEACAEGQIPCSGVCRNPLVDSGNCGRCNNVCSVSQYCNNGVCSGGTANPLVTGITTLAPAGGLTCAAGMTPCSGVCRNLQADTSNCGRCGNVCGSGRTCSSGACSGRSTTIAVTTPVTTVPAPLPDSAAAVTTTTTPWPACPFGTTRCGGSCVDTNTDNNNCYGCGNVCRGGRSCVAGICSCPAGFDWCGGTCINRNTDNTNCGGCGIVCSGGSNCVAGVCRCPSGEIRCGGTCTNPNTDNNNCYGCGNVCRDGRSCVAGICSCPAGFDWCGGTCINRNTDNTNCGGCGIVCSGISNCVAGVCRCPSGFIRCGATCLDPSTDANNCGGCGTVCPYWQSCNSGICTGDLPVVITTTASSGCGKGLTPCASGKFGIVCVDLDTDNNNCGYCGNVCTTGSCSGGTCSFVLK